MVDSLVQQRQELKGSCARLFTVGMAMLSIDYRFAMERPVGMHTLRGQFFT